MIRGADVLIDGASTLAKRIGISDLIVGLTVVAFGTSLPELIVNVFASSEGASDIAIGNVVGSNIANILLILGIVALIKPLPVRRLTVWREILFSVLAAFVLAVLVSDHFIDTSFFNGLNQIDGFVLITYFGLFLFYTFGNRSHLNSADIPKRKKGDAPAHIEVARTLTLIIMGIVGLALGGKWIVDGASAIAAGFGISDAIISLTVVAIGTSAPELAASIAAVKKDNVDVAVGNAVGSNLFNTFWVLGLSAFINPMRISDALYVDIMIAVAVACILFLSMLWGKTRHSLERREGVIFVSLYIAYIGFLISREIWF